MEQAQTPSDVVIYQKSCEAMDELADGCVDLVVTSPPYWNSIDYAQHTTDPTQWYRTRQGGPYEEYRDWLRRCFREVARVLKPGGHCSVVIGTVLYKGEYYPLPYHFVGLMEDLGLALAQDIIWHKVTGGVKRAGVTIQNPYPGYYYPNLMTEFILVFRKPGPPLSQNRPETERERDRIPIDDLFKHELANNIWHIAPVPPNTLDHPCPFPEEIPYRLIRLYTYQGDLVLDPFAGSGTTLKVARHLGRRAVGYEVAETYVRRASARLREPLNLRRLLIPRYERRPWAPHHLQASLWDDDDAGHAAL